MGSALLDLVVMVYNEENYVVVLECDCSPVGGEQHLAISFKQHHRSSLDLVSSRLLNLKSKSLLPLF